MPTRIRLQRKGKKGLPVYHVVIADGRAPRDGKFIERIGIYNPVSKPAVIDINFDRALYWLQSGAEPTDTVNALLSFKGVLYKHHLLKGVSKGAMTEEMAEAKFQAWLQEKQDKFIAKIKEEELSGKESRKKRIEAEMKVNEERAKELQAKRAKELQAIEAENAGDDTEAEPQAEVTGEAVAESTPVAEEKPAEVAETTAETEAVAEEKPAEVAEAPAETEAVAEEKPAEVAEVPAKTEAVAEEKPAEVAEAPAKTEAVAEEKPAEVAEAPAETEAVAEEKPVSEEPAKEEETETKS